MKLGMVSLLLLFSVSASAGEWTQQQVNEYNACFPILRELKGIKILRDRNMETSGPKTLAEVEKDWQSKASYLGCSSWQGEFDRRNP